MEVYLTGWKCVHMRVWPIGWASDRLSDQRSSILRARSRICRWDIAQLAERRSLKSEVVGSSPTVPATGR